MERSIGSYLRMWLGVPKTLTSVALNSSTVKLQLLHWWRSERSLKARLYMMLRDSRSADPVIRTVRPDVQTGKKWSVVEAVEEVETQGDCWSCPAGS